MYYFDITSEAVSKGWNEKEKNEEKKENTK